jgi:myosin heavy subunit
MGVLDTIKVRQESFPQRKIYQKFYQRYEELNSKGSKIFFDDHVKQGSDFLQLSKECVSESWPEKTDKMLLWGKTKVFMTLEGQYMLEDIRREKM